MSEEMNATKLVPANKRRIRPGGLMRCCLMTIKESDALTRIGDRWQCRFHDGPALRIAADGVWEWDHGAGTIPGEGR